MRTWSDEIIAARRSLHIASNNVLNDTASLITETNAFVDLAQEFEWDFRELKKKEEELRVKEMKLVAKDKELEAKAKRMDEREKELQDREQKIMEQEKLRTEMQARMEANAAKFQSMVEISVGGQRFDIPKTTLLQFKGSYFEAMLTTDHQQLYNGKFFIDYNPVRFNIILDYMRNKRVSKSFLDNQEELREDFDFFNLPFPRVLPTHVATPIHQWLPERKFDLLYKASRDGFNMEDFHRRCDNKGATLSIIESDKGFLFGGYSPISWGTDTRRDKAHPYFFLFTIKNPHGISPTKYILKDLNDPNAFRSTRYHVAFGNGCDLRVADSEAHRRGQSYSWFGNAEGSYEDTTGKGNETFTGKWEFKVKEVEVYLVI